MGKTNRVDNTLQLLCLEDLVGADTRERVVVALHFRVLGVLVGDGAGRHRGLRHVLLAALENAGGRGGERLLDPLVHGLEVLRGELGDLGGGSESQGEGGKEGGGLHPGG